MSTFKRKRVRQPEDLIDEDTDGTRQPEDRIGDMSSPSSVQDSSTRPQEPTIEHTTHHQTSFQFAELPAELRNKIYELTLNEFRKDVYMRRITWRDAVLPISKSSYHTMSQVCRTARPEFASLYKARTTFHVELHDFDNVMQTFNMVDYDGEIGGIVTAMRSPPDGPSRVVILPLLKFLRDGTKRLKVKADRTPWFARDETLGRILLKSHDVNRLLDYDAIDSMVLATMAPG